MVGSPADRPEKTYLYHRLRDLPTLILNRKEMDAVRFVNLLISSPFTLPYGIALAGAILSLLSLYQWSK